MLRLLLALLLLTAPVAQAQTAVDNEDVGISGPDDTPQRRPDHGEPMERIVAGMNQTFVSIDATFVGSEILIFGAVSRDAPMPPGRLGVVIVVEGPNEPVTVRRKEKRFGIWVNTEAFRVQSAPTFYSVASTGPLDEVLSEEDNARRLVSIDKAVWVWDLADRDGEEEFAEALIRIRTDGALYNEAPNSVRLTRHTLFNTTIDLPANLTEGLYKTRIFLTRDGKIVSDHTSFVSVEKVGLERWLYNLAQDYALLYALLSLAIAIAAGYLASTLFRLFSSS